MTLLDGLYKVEYGVNDAFGRSIMCLHDGRMLGGNSGFAHLGTYVERDGEIIAQVITERHNLDPSYKPLMGADVASIGARGRLYGNQIRLEGGADTMPGARFWANLTRLDDEGLPPSGVVGPGGIANGLYGMGLRALDGVDAGLSGVMLLIEGRILGGDAFFYYLGAYSSADGRWKGEMLNQEHTPAKGENPVFGASKSASDSPGPARKTAASLKASRSRASEACPCGLAQADAKGVANVLMNAGCRLRGLTHASSWSMSASGSMRTLAELTAGGLLFRREGC